MTSPLAIAAAMLALSAPAGFESFRFSRPIEATPGWSRLVLPDDVLGACRAGLPDLRIVDASGREVPYAIEREPSDRWKSYPALNLESVEDIETLFVIDRGARPGIADAVTLEVAGSEFLKPVRIQSSDDRSSWKDVASGSIFATGDVRMRTVPLPDTDRRYLRFRLDDRNGPPVRPSGVRVRGRSGEARAVPERPVALEPRVAEPDSEAGKRSRFAATLPTGNLAVSALRFQIDDAAFSRPVRVYERVFFRDEVHRRLVAEGVLSRAPGERTPIDLAAWGIAGRNLEIDIEDGDSPPLAGLEVRALVRSTTLRFLAPPSGALTLLYGSASARPPSYDLARVLAKGPGAGDSAASLGLPVAVASAAPLAPVKPPARAPLAGLEAWTVRRAIELPARSGVAYLDLDSGSGRLGDVRIVDSENRQVPFIVEQGSHPHASEIRLEIETDGTATRARIEDLPDATATDALELRASGPDYFSREVRIEEEERDARGVTGTRTLGAARWERRPGEPAPALRIPISRPRDPGHRLFVVIENGDNVPLSLAGARAFTSAVRLDFVFEPGEKLSFLSGNPQARPPAYDLAMLAPAVLAAPAEAARLGPPPAAAAAQMAGRPRPPWFWAAIAAAVLLLLFQLGRVLKKAS